jgi:hypothetical protein
MDLPVVRVVAVHSSAVSPQVAALLYFRRPVMIQPSLARPPGGVLDLGVIMVQFTSFCLGTLTVQTNSGGIIAGSDGVHVSHALFFGDEGNEEEPGRRDDGNSDSMFCRSALDLETGKDMPTEYFLHACP